MSERGDRATFLAGIRRRTAGAAVAGPHPRPAPRADAPAVRFRVLDGIDPADRGALLRCFMGTAAAATVTVHPTPSPAVPPALLAAIVAECGAARAVLSAETEAQGCRAALEALGVAVDDYDRAATAADADLGVTSAVAAVAATGSVVVSSSAAQGRGVSLLPRVHLCVVPADRLVATPADVLRDRNDPPPSNLVFITGPSRTGDIEQVMTLGVHGPTAVHVIVTGAPVLS
jgi:L-lactate dehydrogenase complex protein LldG